jgi:hypothetical protein
VAVQRARDRAKETKTRRQRLREALLGSDWVRVERLTPARRANRPVWRVERYGPRGLGTHRDPRFAGRDLDRSR